MRNTFLLFLYVNLFTGSACGQVTGNNSKEKNTRPVAAIDCYHYFPVKAGSSFRYLKSSRSINNPAVTVYELTETYYPANARRIEGKLLPSFLKDQQLKFVASDINSLFRITSLNRTDRVYIGCTTEKNETRLFELQEVLQQNSKITGYYTQVTESYKSRSSIVPGSVTYQDMPLIEIERLGTGVFNTNFLYSSSRKNDEYLFVNQEIRQDRAETSRENPYEYREFFYGETMDELEVQGKKYKDVIGFGTRIYKSAKQTPANPVPVAYEQAYYAAGIGLIQKIRIEKSGLGYYNNSLEQGLNRMLSGKADDRSENFTIWELLPEGVSAEKGLKKQTLIYEEESIRTMVDNFFPNPDYTPTTNSKSTVKAQKSTPKLQGDIDKRLLGLWIEPYPNRNAEKYSYLFKEDGTCEFNTDGALSEKPFTGEWRVNNGALLILIPQYISSIQTIPLKIETDIKTGKPSFLYSGGSRYYRVETNEVTGLLQKLKPERVIAKESEILTGSIIKEYVGTWASHPGKTETYVLNADGSGLWITESEKKAEYQFKTVVKINWRVKDGVFLRQSICDEPPCPRGNRFIDKIGSIEIASDKGKAAIKIARYSWYYKQ